jgi:hypothetical protein
MIQFLPIILAEPLTSDMAALLQERLAIGKSIWVGEISGQEEIWVGGGGLRGDLGG